jgi:hypothetical protein
MTHHRQYNAWVKHLSAQLLHCLVSEGKPLLGCNGGDLMVILLKKKGRWCKTWMTCHCDGDGGEGGGWFLFWWRYTVFESFQRHYSGFFCLYKMWDVEDQTTKMFIAYCCTPLWSLLFVPSANTKHFSSLTNLNSFWKNPGEWPMIAWNDEKWTGA